MKMRKLQMFLAGLLAQFAATSVIAQPGTGLMPYDEFMKLPIPGAMKDFPGKARTTYQPFVWNRMLTRRAMGPFEMKSIQMDESEEFAWSYPIIQLIGQGNPLSGEQLAKRHKCAKCHGDTGISDENDTPSIAGQARPYAFKQMVEYKHKIRVEKQMSKKMRELTYAEIADLAAFYEVQRPEKSVIRHTAVKPPKLVIHGDRSRFLIPCADCHGRWGEGIGFEAPAIAGQKAEHFVDTMTEFKEGDRTNDLYGRMRFITQQLTDDEIEELASYYASIASLQEEEE